MAEPADRRPNLSDVHISDTEDSHSNTTLPLGIQTTEPKPPLNGDQLLKMLSTMQIQMENQHTEMIRLREVNAREKEVATCVQTRLLKQIGTQRKSQSTPTAGRNERALPSPPVHENPPTPLGARDATD